MTVLKVLAIVVLMCFVWINGYMVCRVRFHKFIDNLFYWLAAIEPAESHDKRYIAECRKAILKELGREKEI